MLRTSSSHLPRLDPDKNSTVLKMLLQDAQKERVHFQLLIGRRIHESMIESSEIWTPTMADIVLKAARTLMDSKTSFISDCWSDVMIETIVYLTESKLESDILPEAIVNSGFAQPVPVRLWSCRMFGALSLQFNAKKIETLYLRRAIALCQDTDYEVRTMMCRQLNNLVIAMTGANGCCMLLDEYLELLKDDEIQVRKEALVNFLQLVQPSHKRQRCYTDRVSITSVIIPEWKRLLEEKNSALMQDLVQSLGPWLCGVKDYISDFDVAWTLSWLEKLVLPQILCLSISVRVACAYNLPGLFWLLAQRQKSNESGTTKAFTSLQKVFIHLMADKDKEVAVQVATCIPEICRQLNELSYSILKEHFVPLLVDGSDEVCEKLMSSYDSIIHSFSRSPKWSKTDMSCGEYLSAYIKRLQAVVSASARNPQLRHFTIHLWVLQSTNFYRFFDSDSISSDLVPLFMTLLNRTHSSLATAELQDSLTMVLSHFSLRMSLINQREKIVRTLKDFARVSNKNSSSRHRLIFLSFCEHTLAIASAAHFTDSLLEAFIDLASDPVESVRFKAVCMIPKLLKGIKASETSFQIMLDLIGKLIKEEKNSSIITVLEKVLIHATSLAHSSADEAECLRRKYEESALLQAEQESENMRRKVEFEDTKSEFARRSTYERAKSNVSGFHSLARRVSTTYKANTPLSPSVLAPVPLTQSSSSTPSYNNGRRRSLGPVVIAVSPKVGSSLSPESPNEKFSAEVLVKKVPNKKSQFSLQKSVSADATGKYSPASSSFINNNNFLKLHSHSTLGTLKPSTHLAK